MEESQISQVECFIRAVEVTADGRGSAWGETQSKNDAHRETLFVGIWETLLGTPRNTWGKSICQKVRKRPKNFKFLLTV